jgi:aminotransferase
LIDTSKGVIGKERRMSKDYISERVRHILTGEDNPFLQLLSLASKYDGIVALGRGDPDLPTPSHVVEAAARALQSGQTKYTAPTGIFELRKAISEQFKSKHQLDYDPNDEVIVTAGTQEAIYLSMLSLVNPGDEVLIPEPYYACYADSTKLAGGVVVPVPTKVEHNFEVSAEEIRKRVTPRTKLIALASPTNPSGAIVPKETMREIAVIAEENDLLVLSDELYEHIMFDGKKPICFATMPNMRERSIILNGFSKAFAMTGLRIGYLVGPKHLVKPMSVPHHSMVICANSVAQEAALAAITGPQDFLAEYNRLYDERRLIVMEELDAGGVRYGRPSGGFFVFADIRATKMNSFEFCKGLLEETRVQVFPGTMYGTGMDGFVRISFLAEKDKLRQAMKDFVMYYRTKLPR